MSNNSDQLFAQANEQFVAEDYQAAADLYNSAIQSNPNSANYYIARSANSLKLKKYQAAVTDADSAIKLDNNNNQAFLRKATGLFYLDNFAEAKQLFEKSQLLGNKQAAIWIRKCDAELDRNNSNKSNNNTVSNAATIAAPQRPQATSVAAAVDRAAASIPATGAIAVPSNLSLAQKVKDSFYQIKTHITVTFFAKNLKEEDTKVALDPADNKSFDVQLRMPDSSLYTKQFKLFAPVQLNFKKELTPYKLEVTFEKLSAEDWVGLEEVAAAQLQGVVKRENVVQEGVTPAYPSSSKKKTNFAELEKQAKEQEEEPQGEQALQKLFQTIYKDASEDTRRAMIKSFQTSGGTVLSTNWDEVGKADYTKDRTAPNGQEFRDWNNPTGRKEKKDDSDEEELAG
jgi:tetratricopeptide (TPR) repeat protein